MENKKILATIMDNKPIEISVNKTLLEISKDYESLFNSPIVLAKVNNQLQELYKTLTEDCKIEFLDITDANGFRAYQRSIAFLAIYAAKSVLGRKTRIVIEHSINKNYYCEIPEENLIITDEILQQIEAKMVDTVHRNLPIEKFSISVEKGLALAKEFDLKDKMDILKYRRSTNVNFYKLDWFYDYFYGQMVPRAGYLKNFKIIKKEPGFIIQFPLSNEELCELKPVNKISQVFSESSRWAKILKVDTVGALNNMICNDNLGHIIRISEALHEKKIAEIADMILNEKKSIVLIAGPSSSGKTTFAERLCIQLRVNGLRPHIISMDNYFDTVRLPLDECGRPDYEAIEYVDTEQINEDLSNLLKGRKVEIPTFNFLSNKREYKGTYLKLEEDDVIVMEGIHALNEKSTEQISKSDKFKVFISALTQLNVDDHNRIPTTDSRLIRRIVRDHQFRGFSATRTISMWPSVMRGESNNIFPFQEEADAMFNSALVYEMCILKQFVEPLLFKIEKTCGEYTEARRIIKFLDSFLGANSEQVPKNSILREFIGGSCFYL